MPVASIARHQHLIGFRVTYIEGNVTRLIKDNGVVKGVVYKIKDEEEEKVGAWIEPNGS